MPARPKCPSPFAITHLVRVISQDLRRSNAETERPRHGALPSPVSDRRRFGNQNVLAPKSPTSSTSPFGYAQGKPVVSLSGRQPLSDSACSISSRTVGSCSWASCSLSAFVAAGPLSLPRDQAAAARVSMCGRLSARIRSGTAAESPLFPTAMMTFRRIVSTPALSANAGSAA